MPLPTSAYCYGFRVRATNWPVSRPIVGLRLRWLTGGIDEEGNYFFDESADWLRPENQVLGPNRWTWEPDYNAYVIPGTGGAVDETFLFRRTWTTGYTPGWVTLNPTVTLETSPDEDTLFTLDACRGDSVDAFSFPSELNNSSILWGTNITRQSGRKWALRDTIDTLRFNPSYEVLREVVPGQTMNLAVFGSAPVEGA